MPVTKDLQDLDLIDRILNGEESACKMLVDKHKDYAFTIAYRILDNREEAEEVSQDAFIKSFKSLQGFNRDSKFTTWFYRVVHNLAVSQLRKKKTHFDTLEEHYDLESDGIEIDDISMKERKQYLEMAMKRLVPDDTTMLTLFYLREFSLEEIAEITEIAANTIKVKLFRARKRLAIELQLILQNEVNSLL